MVCVVALPLRRCFACQRFFSRTRIVLEDGLEFDHDSGSPIRKARETMRELQAAQVAAGLDTQGAHAGRGLKVDQAHVSS